jgi:hypothetical protein
MVMDSGGMHESQSNGFNVNSKIVDFPVIPLVQYVVNYVPQGVVGRKDNKFSVNLCIFFFIFVRRFDLYIIFSDSINACVLTIFTVCAIVEIVWCEELFRISNYYRWNFPMCCTVVVHMKVA